MPTFQKRVDDWILYCFGPKIGYDLIERNHRFIEESLELVQAAGCTKDEAHQLVDYVYGRPKGEIGQEVGGVMNTLAALCTANNIDLDLEAEKELSRVWPMSDQIRAKQAAKPKHSPLPVAIKETKMSNAPKDMPSYRSHKVVRALKIDGITFDRDTDKPGATIFPEDKKYAPFEVDPDYVAKHKPQAGGYYVVYADGYQSWSPAQAFEEGNTRIKEEPSSVVGKHLPRLYLGSMNDGLFIIDRQPSPANTDVGPWVSANGPTVIIPCGDNTTLAERLVAAWNKVIDDDAYLSKIYKREK